MPSEIIRVEGQVREGRPYWSLHHVQFPDGTKPLKADLSGAVGQEIGYTVYDLGGKDPATAIITSSFDKAVAWFDTLQNDGFWDNEDADGYDFRGKHPASDYPNGAGKYKIEYVANTSKTDALGVTFEFLAWEETIEVFGRFDA